MSFLYQEDRRTGYEVTESNLVSEAGSKPSISRWKKSTFFSKQLSYALVN